MDQLEVRIVRLEAMRVLSFHAFGASPEDAAWKKLEAWAKPRGYLDQPETHRIFGFNNPDPSEGSPNYGYEYWKQVGPEEQGDEQAEIKHFAGGLYAVTRCVVTGEHYEIIGATWHKLIAWQQNSRYKHAHHQWLEEHLFIGKTPGGFTLDLYMPISE